ncbi:MAG: hypothetical protein ACRETE_04160 [Stenotrophobium sp.]
MSRLAVRAEIIKLARLYRVKDSTLDFLQNISADEIRKLRQAAQERLFSDDLTLFQRLALASKLLPTSLIAMMAEKIFGPILGARVAGEMNYKRAVELAGRLPLNFLADISLQLDPGRAKDIIRNLPPERIRDVAVELLRRREFITMGRFVDYVTEAAIRKAMEAFTQPADLLHVGFFIENKTQLNGLIRMLNDERLRGVIVAAQDPVHDLWSEAVALMAFVDDELKRKLGDLAADQDESALDGLVATAYRQQLWDDVLPVVACMSEESHRKLLRLRALSDPAVMEGILRAADENGLWPSFLPLVGMMSPEQLVLVAETATTHLPPKTLENILRAADSAGMWKNMLHLAGGMNEAQLTQVGAAASTLPQEAIQHILQVADELDLWHKLLPLAGKMSDTHKRMIAAHAALVPQETRARILAAARNADNRLWPALLDIVAHIPREQRAEFAELVADHAVREPHLVDELAPAAKARGLDDLLDVARQALRGNRRQSLSAVVVTKEKVATSEDGMQQDPVQSKSLASNQNVLAAAPKERLRRVARTVLKRVENVIGVSDDPLIEQLKQIIEAQSRQLQEMTDGVWQAPVQLKKLALNQDVLPVVARGRLRRVARTAFKQVENVIGVSDGPLIEQLRQTVQTQRQQLQETARRLQEAAQRVRKAGQSYAASKQENQRKGFGIASLRSRLGYFLAHTVESSDKSEAKPMPGLHAMSSAAVAVSAPKPVAGPAQRSSPVPVSSSAQASSAPKSAPAAPRADASARVAPPVKQAAAPAYKPAPRPAPVVVPAPVRASAPASAPANSRSPASAPAKGVPPVKKPGLSRTAKLGLALAGCVVAFVLAIAGGFLFPVLFH